MENATIKPSIQSRPIVLYDGSCPLCSREIRHYRNRKHADRLEWIDASKAYRQLEILGVDQASAMSVFHVRDDVGNWRYGADGFIYLWSQLPAYQWLAWTVDKLRLQPLLAWGYRHFLVWRNANRCADSCG